MVEEVEVAIVGAGTAGLSALRAVRSATEDFLVINEGGWGTTCATTGCMPSKALIEAANALHRARGISGFGLRGGEAAEADLPAVLERVRRFRDEMASGPAATPRELGARAVQGRARLLGPDLLEVGERRVRARAVILAPGSSPVVPGPWRDFGDRILTTDTLFEQRDLPRRLAVVGLGAVGAELAQALARLGLEVEAFDADEAPAGASAPEVAEAAREALSRDLALHLGAEAELASAGDAIEVRGAHATFRADAVLAALGRKPQVDGLNLEVLGVPLDDHGLPEVDPRSLRIGDLPVWLAGDSNGQAPLLHEASDDGWIAGRSAVGAMDGLCDRRIPLKIAFTDPGVAQVGRGIADLASEDVVTGVADFARQGRARAGLRGEGTLHVHAERVSGRLLGAEMCVPEAEHLAHLLALALERRLTAHEVLAMPFYHPTLEEGLRTALRKAAAQVQEPSGRRLSHCSRIGLDALE